MQVRGPDQPRAVEADRPKTPNSTQPPPFVWSSQTTCSRPAARRACRANSPIRTPAPSTRPAASWPGGHPRATAAIKRRGARSPAVTRDRSLPTPALVGLGVAEAEPRGVRPSPNGRPPRSIHTIPTGNNRRRPAKSGSTSNSGMAAPLTRGSFGDQRAMSSNTDGESAGPGSQSLTAHHRRPAALRQVAGTFHQHRYDIPSVGPTGRSARRPARASGPPRGSHGGFNEVEHHLPSEFAGRLPSGLAADGFRPPHRARPRRRAGPRP